MGPRGRSELAILTLFQPLVKEPLVAEKRRKPTDKHARGVRVVRIESRRLRPALREP